MILDDQLLRELNGFGWPNGFHAAPVIFSSNRDLPSDPSLKLKTHKNVWLYSKEKYSRRCAKSCGKSGNHVLDLRADDRKPNDSERRTDRKGLLRVSSGKK